ncbi:MAG: LysR family transcriptional regulator [Pseudomonadota bacterium]
MTKTLDRIDLLRLFVRIVEVGSLSAAGRALGLSQPSVSRQLRALEADVGAELLRRTTHDMSLTDAGRLMLEEAQSLLAGWDSLSDRLRGGTQALEGPAVVLAPLGLGQTLLADSAARFAAAHPGVRLDWRLDDAPRDLTEEGIDLWLRIGPVADEGLIVSALGTMPRVIVAAPALGAADTPEALAELPAVLLGPYASALTGVQGPDGAVADLPCASTHRTDNVFAARRLAVAGLGFAVLPWWLVSEDILAGRLHVLCPDWHPPGAPLHLAYRPARYRPARLTALIAHFVSEAAEGRLTQSPG